MRSVESGGRSDAVGDDGRSLGPYQISAAYWVDGGGEPGRYRLDARDAVACERVIAAYWRRHCPRALAAGDLEILARTHNGGPRGPQRAATLSYWGRIRAALHVTEADQGPARRRDADQVRGPEGGPGRS